LFDYLKQFHKRFPSFDMLRMKYNSQTLRCKQKQRCDPLRVILSDPAQYLKMIYHRKNLKCSSVKFEKKSNPILNTVLACRLAKEHVFMAVFRSSLVFRCRYLKYCFVQVDYISIVAREICYWKIPCWENPIFCSDNEWKKFVKMFFL